MEKVPRHVAIVMDGNRRWAKRHNLPAKQGHIAGSNNLQPLVEAAADLGIKILTVYGFSTENWRRSKAEVALLMQLIGSYLRDNREHMVKKGVRFSTIGDLAPLPMRVKKEIEITKKMTEKGKTIDLVIAINYGARDEIKRACHLMCVDFAQKKLSADMISEKTIEKYLDTSCIGDPDLFIRTSGEMRISNFLLWQLAYTELFMTEVLWPDFSKKDLQFAIEAFQKRDRRVGS